MRSRSAASSGGSRPARRPSRPRSSAGVSGGNRNSPAGSTTAWATAPVERWSAGSNARRESISSPKNSARTGSDWPGGNRSTMPPRLANSPRPPTSVTASYPRSISSRSSRSWGRRAPRRRTSGAAGKASDGRVRWSRAWGLVTRMRAGARCSAAPPSVAPPSAAPVRHAAIAATRAAVSSRTSSPRSYASAVRGSSTTIADGSPSHAASSSATRSAISASRATQARRSPVALASAAARNVLAP